MEINNTKSNSSAMVSAEKKLVIQTVIAPMRNYLDPFMIRHQNLPYGAYILGWKLKALHKKMEKMLITTCCFLPKKHMGKK